MGTGDFRGNVQAKPQSLLVFRHLAAHERLKQAAHGQGRNRFAAIGDGEFKLALVIARAHPDRFVSETIGQGIAQQVGEKLADAVAVAKDQIHRRIVRLDHPVRPGHAQFGHHMFQHRL